MVHRYADRVCSELNGMDRHTYGMDGETDSVDREIVLAGKQTGWIRATDRVGRETDMVDRNAYGMDREIDSVGREIDGG